MIARNHSRSEMQCIVPPLLHKQVIMNKMAASGLVMDIRNLTFEDGTFDIVIDKGNRFPVRNGQRASGLRANICIIHRYDGRHDDGQGRCLGRVPLCCDVICENILTRKQDPPQQVIDDCTKEIDEVLRFGRPPFFWHVKFLIVVWFFPRSHM